MGWIFFQESVELGKHLPLGSEQSPIVSVKDTLKAFCCPECQKVRLIQHQSGMMSQHSHQTCCQESKSSVEGSPAKTSVLQDMEEDWKEAEAVFFSRLSDLQETSDQGSFFLRMSLPSGQEVSTLSSKNCQKSGLIVDGQCFQLQKLGHPTKGKGGSFWPTPNASDRKGANMKDGHDLKKGYLRGVVKQDSPQTSGQLNPEWVEWLMGYKTGVTELSAWAMEWFRSK